VGEPRHGTTMLRDIDCCSRFSPQLDWRETPPASSDEQHFGTGFWHNVCTLRVIRHTAVCSGTTWPCLMHSMLIKMRCCYLGWTTYRDFPSQMCHLGNLSTASESRSAPAMFSIN